MADAPIVLITKQIIALAQIKRQEDDLDRIKLANTQLQVVKKDAEEDAEEGMEKDAVEGMPVKGKLLQMLEGKPVDWQEEGELLQMLEGEAVD